MMIHAIHSQEVHTRLHRHIKSRTQSLESGKGVDWGTAEVRPRKAMRHH